MDKPFFEGWYIKHQKGGDILAFIPGRADSGAFVQVISPTGSRFFAMPELVRTADGIALGKCRFSPRGCQIHLPGIQGEITYGQLCPLDRDIMGPFRYFPMECRHGVVSMSHSLSGTIWMDGQRHCFDGGVGYMETDSGTSFPSAYQWVQCNDFSVPCSLMVSIARIPFYGIRFRGCISAMMLGSHVYRFATYDGARVLVSHRQHIRLTQGRYLLEIDLAPSHAAHPLYAPKLGQMSGTVRECCSAAIQLRLWEKGRRIVEASSDHAVWEFVEEA